MYPGTSTRTGAPCTAVGLGTPSLPSKRAATCGNAASDRSATFQVRERIVRARSVNAMVILWGNFRVKITPGGGYRGSCCALNRHYRRLLWWWTKPGTAPGGRAAGAGDRQGAA